MIQKQRLQLKMKFLLDDYKKILIQWEGMNVWWEDENLQGVASIGKGNFFWGDEQNFSYWGSFSNFPSRENPNCAVLESNFYLIYSVVVGFYFVVNSLLIPGLLIRSNSWLHFKNYQKVTYISLTLFTSISHIPKVF